MLTVYIRVQDGYNKNRTPRRKWVAVPGVYASKWVITGSDEEIWQLQIRATNYKRPWTEDLKVSMGKWYTMIRRKKD